MKLATYKDGSRDGQLVVVSRDLSQAHYATGIATRLQQVLDDWNFLSPLLQDLSVTLNHGKARHAFAFEPRQCMAPLPRAYQWAELCSHPLAEQSDECSAQHGDEHAEPPGPAGAGPAPLLRHAASDFFLGPCDEAGAGALNQGLEPTAALAAITGDVALGADAGLALDGVRLLALVNPWSWPMLPQLRPPLRPAPMFAPVAVTPDELGGAWRAGRAHLSLKISSSGAPPVLVETGAAMPFHFGQLIAPLAAARPVRAGSMVAAVICPGGLARGPAGSGSAVQIEAIGRDGHSLFGAITQP